jgi:hypothetical protein
MRIKTSVPEKKCVLLSRAECSTLYFINLTITLLYIILVLIINNTILHKYSKGSFRNKYYNCILYVVLQLKLIS